MQSALQPRAAILMVAASLCLFAATRNPAVNLQVTDQTRSQELAHLSGSVISPRQLQTNHAEKIVPVSNWLPHSGGDPHATTAVQGPRATRTIQGLTALSPLSFLFGVAAAAYAAVQLVLKALRVRDPPRLTAVPIAMLATTEVDFHWTAEQIATTKANAVQRLPFSETELDRAISSLRTLAARDAIDWSAVRDLLRSSAHLPHQDWARTEAAATQLEKLLLGLDDPAFRRLFHRVMADGGWSAALAAAAARKEQDPNEKPWVVLVTGLNGIRKTTTIYQPWFQELLTSAIGKGDMPVPVGQNSFFRQLDFIIATVASEDFRALYKLTDLTAYSAAKDAIYARYRTIAEMVGAIFLRACQRNSLNVMVETSGRDVAMFNYIEHFFPDASYNKLVLNFTVNDLRFAEASVDIRMAEEMAAGQAALQRGFSAPELVAVNAGGPYGSAALRQVQQESQKVWQQVQNGEVAQEWYKASIAIHARDGADWFVRPGLEEADTKGAKKYIFQRRS